MSRLGATPSMDENDYRLVYLVLLVRFAHFVFNPRRGSMPLFGQGRLQSSPLGG